MPAVEADEVRAAERANRVEGAAAVFEEDEVLGAARPERLQQPPPFGAGNPHAFEIYGAVLVFFFAISFPLTRLAAYLKRRLV